MVARERQLVSRTTSFFYGVQTENYNLANTVLSTECAFSKIKARHPSCNAGKAATPILIQCN